MKKFTGLFMMLMLVVSVSYGQESTTKDNYAYGNAIDIAYELSSPLGNFADAAGTSGFGTTIRYEFNMGKGWAGMLTTGYIPFADKNSQDYSAVPLMIGTKLHFTPGWYGMVETGLHFMSNSGSIGDANATVWGYSLGTGYEIPLSKLLSIDISTKYQYNANDFSYWNARAGLMFKF